MSAFGTKRTSRRAQSMSAFGCKADIGRKFRNVCLLVDSHPRVVVHHQHFLLFKIRQGSLAPQSRQPTLNLIYAEMETCHEREVRRQIFQGKGGAMRAAGGWSSAKQSRPISTHGHG